MENSIKTEFMDRITMEVFQYDFPDMPTFLRWIMDISKEQVAQYTCVINRNGRAIPWHDPRS